MLDKFIGDAIAGVPGFAGIAYETIDERAVRLVIEVPELGHRIFVEVCYSSDEGIAVLSLRIERSVEGEMESVGEVAQKGLAELRRRWPEIVVQVRNTREGVDLEYETILPRRRSAGLEGDAELAKDFVAVLPRLRDCVVRSFHFINVLCVSSQVDVRLLDGGQDFTLEWAFVQECGGLVAMRHSVDELCDILAASRDEVLQEAITALNRAKLAEERTVAQTPPDGQRAGAIGTKEASHVPAVLAAVGAESIGLTLEELISFGP